MREGPRDDYRRKAVISKSAPQHREFKLREASPMAAGTLRRNAMYEFFDRLIATACRAFATFAGCQPRKFDGRGNYTFGHSGQTIFRDRTGQNQADAGMDVTIVTSAANDAEALDLLKLMGFPLAEVKEAPKEVVKDAAMEAAKAAAKEAAKELARQAAKKKRPKQRRKKRPKKQPKINELWPRKHGLSAQAQSER